MIGLNKSELEENHLYEDMLSGKRVLIISKQNKSEEIENKVYEWVEVTALIYAENYANYNTVTIMDGQLVELK